VKAATIAPSSVHELDLQLVERYRVGDGRAFDEVYTRYEAMVYNLALRLSGSADEAADLTQEIFLRICRHLGSFSGRSALKTWVYRVALNHCRERLSRLRPRWQSIGEPGESGALTLADPARGPEDLAVAAEEGRRVSGALAKLQPAFREAVILRDIEGLSYQEIAEVLRVRVGTVRSRIARGRDQLRTLLESDHEFSYPA
jgi:RNA polymerase sigma-70 factor (ECF subfamily)